MTSPDAACTLLLVRSRRESPVATFAVDRKRRWNPTPGRWLRLLLNPASNGFQAADLIKLDGFNSRIGDWQRFAGDTVPCLELVLGVSAFPYTDPKFSILISDTASHQKRVTKICMAALIERAAQANPGLRKVESEPSRRGRNHRPKSLGHDSVRTSSEFFAEHNSWHPGVEIVGNIQPRTPVL